MACLRARRRISDERATRIPPAPLPLIVYWLCQFTGWGLYAIASFLGALVVVCPPAQRAALDLLILTVLGLGFYALRAYMRAHGWAALPRTARIGRVLLASSVCGLAIATVKVLFGLAPWQTDNFPIELGPMRRSLTFVLPGRSTGRF